MVKIIKEIKTITALLLLIPWERVKAQTGIWIIKAADRAFSADENFYENVIKLHVEQGKPFLLILNQADKIEPIGRTTELSAVQKINLERKIGDVKRIFRTDNVIAYSAETGYNFDTLVTKIACMVRSECR